MHGRDRSGLAAARWALLVARVRGRRVRRAREAERAAVVRWLRREAGRSYVEPRMGSTYDALMVAADAIEGGEHATGADRG